MGAAVMVVGTALSVYASQQRADAEADQLHANAQLAEDAAADVRTRAEYAAGQKKLEANQTVGTQKVAYAKGNVDTQSGTALATMGQTAALGELDARMLRYNAAREAYGLRVQAGQMRRQAKSVEENAMWSSLGSIVSTSYNFKK